MVRVCLLFGLSDSSRLRAESDRTCFSAFHAMGIRWLSGLLLSSCLEDSRREVRIRLIELGITLTASVARAELASDTALTLI